MIDIVLPISSEFEGLLGLVNIGAFKSLYIGLENLVFLLEREVSMYPEEVAYLFYSAFELLLISQREEIQIGKLVFNMVYAFLG